MKLGTKRFQSDLPFYRPPRLPRLMCSLCIAAGLWLGGCGANAAPIDPDALSKPHDALMVFLNAVGQGDAARARACSIGSDDDKRWIDGMTALLTGLRAYDQAMVGRFGQQAVPLDVDLKQAIFSMANEPIVWFQDGIVKEAEDTAEIDAAVGHVRLMAARPVYLKHDQHGWKVDLAAMREHPDHRPETVAQFLAAGKALQAAASEIRSGRYKTFGDAQQVLGNRPGI